MEVTEAGFTHIFGLRHRTANAFVFTPERGSVLAKTRNKAEAKTFSMAGGHVCSWYDIRRSSRRGITSGIKTLSDRREGKLEGKLIF